MTPEVDLWLLHVHTRMCTHTLAWTHKIRTQTYTSEQVDGQMGGKKRKPENELEECIYLI